jgi:hydrogenase maturation factor/beta-phosphoglucomutase-like phosphatase (HAD superfamily)
MFKAPIKFCQNRGKSASQLKRRWFDFSTAFCHGKKIWAGVRIHILKKAMNTRPYHIKAVLFDWDGTLGQTDERAERKLRSDICCPKHKSVLEFLHSLSIEQPEKDRILAVLDAHERTTMQRFEPHPDAPKVLQYIRSLELPLGVISHTTRTALCEFLNGFGNIGEDDFAVVISREDIVGRAARTDLIGMAAGEFKVSAENVAVISSHPTAIEAARKKGAVSIHLQKQFDTNDPGSDADFVIAHIQEINDIVRMGVPLPAGKLPNPLLRDFLDQFIFEDPSVMINPGVGEDIAAVDIEPEEVLVLKSDPITFATDAIGQYAVLINANDIATSGANPRWLLTTLFFPCGTTPSQIKSVFEELKQYCQHWGITLCGGHTEITDSVIRPIVAGMMAGTVSRKDLIDKRRMQTGDHILFTKGVAVEGTAIIAREFGDRLRKMGLAADDIDQCRHFLDRISIMNEAKIAAKNPGTSAMHDVTEGGLAAAMAELGIAGGHSIRVNMDQIPVFPETKKICGLLGINPLGLIGSGSLLICCRSSKSQELMQHIDAAGIEVTCIGEVMQKGQEILAYKGENETSWPSFEVDEITKLF